MDSLKEEKIQVGLLAGIVMPPCSNTSLVAPLLRLRAGLLGTSIGLNLPHLHCVLQEHLPEHASDSGSGQVRGGCPAYQELCWSQVPQCPRPAFPESGCPATMATDRVTTSPSCIQEGPAYAASYTLGGGRGRLSDQWESTLARVACGREPRDQGKVAQRQTGARCSWKPGPTCSHCSAQVFTCRR